MEDLRKAREAIELLKKLDLPVTGEQIAALNKMEKEYVKKEIIPLIKQELEPLLKDFKGAFRMVVAYERGKGMDVRIINSLENRTNTITNSTENTRDNSRYILEDGAPLKKRRLVLAVVKRYVEEHPGITYNGLKRVFPDHLSNSQMYGVFSKYDFINEKIKNSPDLEKRFFLEPNELISLNDGTIITVYNQWGNHFEKFLEIARSIYNIESV